MKPKMKPDKGGFTAELNVNEKNRLRETYVLASLCEKLGIPGAFDTRLGIWRLVKECGCPGILKEVGGDKEPTQ